MAEGPNLREARMTDLLTMDQVATKLHKSRRWLLSYLKRKPTDRRGDPFCIKLGRTRLFRDNDVERLKQTIAAEQVIISQRVKDAHALMPTLPSYAAGAVVYFVRGGDFIKIGFSKRWQGRMSGLQTGSPVKLELLHVEPGDVAKERALHRHFHHLHSHREWFRAGSELLAYIEMLKGRGH
jgi:hypothetical protein